MSPRAIPLSGRILVASKEFEANMDAIHGALCPLLHNLRISPNRPGKRN